VPIPARSRGSTAGPVRVARGGREHGFEARTGLHSGAESANNGR